MKKEDCSEGIFPTEKFRTIFGQMKLSKTEQEAAELFLAGKTDLDALSSFVPEDLSKIPADPAVRLFRELIKQGEKDLAGRLFLLLLAKGESTCYKMIPMDVIDPEKGAVDTGLFPEKKAAVYAEILGADRYPLGAYSRDCLIAIAGRKPETFQRALLSEKRLSDNGRLILFAFYFFLQYQCGGNPKSVLSPEDIPLLEQYEDAAAKSLDRLFLEPNPFMPAIKKAVQSGQVTEDTLKFAAASKRGISKQAIQLAGSMAYLNYPLSAKLKDIVKICLAAWMKETLNAIEFVSLATSMDIGMRGGAYDKEFGLASEDYIRWAASIQHVPVLKQQLAQNAEAYINVMNEAEINTANKMLSIIKETNPALYENIMNYRKKYGYNQETSKFLNKLIRNNANAPAVRAYLCGETNIETLYPIFDNLGKGYYYSGAKERNLLNSCDKHNLGAAFYRRIQCYMLLCQAEFFLKFEIMECPEDPYLTFVPPSKVADLFQSFTMEGIPISRQLPCVRLIGETVYGTYKKQFFDAAANVFEGYLKNRREETLQAFASSDSEGRLFGLQVLAADKEQNKAEILAYAQDSTKKTREKLFQILLRQKSWEEDIKTLLASKKASVRELAVRVLSSWQAPGTDYQELFQKALEKEKSQKIKELLQEAIRPAGGKSGGHLLSAIGQIPLSPGEFVEEMHKGGKKRSLSWAYDTPFSIVHAKDGNEAKEEYLQAILLCYSSMEEYGYHKGAEFLVEGLNEEEFSIYVNELFDRWLKAGAEKKKSWVLYAASIHGGSQIIPKLEYQIKEWPRHARGVIACEAVQALSLNPSPQALLTVDKMAQKFKFHQIQEAARKAFAFAAKQRGISSEELSDRIVPDLGFDEHARRFFDYGARGFWVAVTPAYEIEVFDASGKKRKSFPAPGKTDDAQKAAASYEEFKEMKKQMKAIAGLQKQRLKMALFSAREWKVQAWEQLFTKNPMMHPFAIGLVWGIYREGKLFHSFRYMEDGSFNTEKEDACFLPSDGRIRLVHPMELTKESRTAWLRQLQDYEIVQPIEQLEHPFYALEPEESRQNELVRFQNKKMDSVILNSRLTGLGWYYKCSEYYCRKDFEAGMAARLYLLEGFSIGEEKEVTIGKVCFHQFTAQDSYGEESKEACPLQKVPPRYFSEVVWQLMKVFGEML